MNAVRIPAARRLVASVLAVLLGGCLIGGRLAQAAAPLPPDAIQRSIDKARDWLGKQQRPDGSWLAMRSADRSVGATGLVLLALANAGLSADDPAVRRGLDWLRGQQPDETYAVSLQTLALAMLAPETDRAILARNVAWLEEAQVRQGRAAGSWSYGR